MRHACTARGVLRGYVCSAARATDLGTHMGRAWALNVAECQGCGYAWTFVTAHPIPAPAAVYRYDEHASEEREWREYRAMYGARWESGRVPGVDPARVGEGAE